MSTPEPGTNGGSGSGPTLVDGIDIDALATAVRSCAAVDDLYSSAAASVASYLPGRQVAGIRIASDTVTVQVRSRWSIPVADVATQVRAATQRLVGGRTIDVVIADIADPPRAVPAELAAVTADAPVHVAQPTGAPFAPGSSEVPPWTPISNAAELPDVSSSRPITPTAVETPPLS